MRFFPPPPSSTELTSYTGMIKHATAAKVAVFTSPLDIAQTETEGIKSADEMLNSTSRGEVHMEKVQFFLSPIFSCLPQKKQGVDHVIHSFADNQRNRH